MDPLTLCLFKRVVALRMLVHGNFQNWTMAEDHTPALQVSPETEAAICVGKNDSLALSLRLLV